MGPTLRVLPQGTLPLGMLLMPRMLRTFSIVRAGWSEVLYLDAAATAPMRREALDAAWPYLTGEFGNPSRQHELGKRAAAGRTAARRGVARVLGVRAGEVTFTSGGTEGDNLAIKGLALARPRGRSEERRVGNGGGEQWWREHERGRKRRQAEDGVGRRYTRT